MSLVLARVSLDALTDAEADEAHALGALAAPLANPELGYTREETLGNGGSGEDYAWVSQRIDISGRAFVRREAGARRAEAVRIGGASRRVALAATVRRGFYRALAASLRGEVHERWVDQIARALAFVTRRVEAGDAAPYDDVRLRRELRRARAQRESERVELDAEIAYLATLAGLDGGFQPWGMLAPAEPSAATSLEERPALRALRELEAAADLDRDAARRGWIPELVLGAGYKGVTTYGPGSTHTDGFTITASLVLPIFDMGASVLERDEARLAVARATLDVGVVDTEARDAALVSRIQGALRVLTAVEDGRAAEAASLVQVASAAYEGGESSLLELLDAHRSVAEDELLAIEIALQARLAMIDLMVLRGEE